MTSVREFFNNNWPDIVSISIKELAHQHNASFPLSLREIVGALPPGRILKRVIPLALLQRKFDEFFNNPKRRPLCKIRLHNVGSGDHRHSTLDVFFDHPAKGYTSQLPDGQPRDLGQLESVVDYHFNDVNSDGLTVTVVPGQPVGIEVMVHFETVGEEIKLNNIEPDINFTKFSITIRFYLEFDRDKGRVDFRTEEKFIKPLVSSNWHSDAVESSLKTRIAEALKDEKIRDILNPLVTRWLVGGDFPVIGVEGNDQALSIDYLVPRGIEPFPENAQPPLDRGLLANIDHIVVLMMENRSFDHMLGYLSKEGNQAGQKRPDVDGLRGGEKNRYKGRDYPSFPLTGTGTVFLESPGHGHACVVNQVNGGKLDGFVADFANHYEEEGVDPGKVMGYYTAAQVPVYDFLAQEFLICQRWFAAHPGPTFPNRFYTLTGRLNRDAHGRFEFDNPHGNDFTPVFTKTIFDHLTEHAVSWHYYEHGYCFLRMFDRYTWDDEYIVEARDPVKGFFANARAGTLPSVSFIDPDFIDVPPGNDDGPPADIAAGQRLVAEVVQAVMESPSWNKTLLVITYDEHGGFFDHVSPPAAIPVSAINECGVRVPTFVISPWVDRGKVTDLVFDHTSIAKYRPMLHERQSTRYGRERGWSERSVDGVKCNTARGHA
jgi:phospholipase C